MDNIYVTNKTYNMKELIKDYVNFWSNEDVECKRPFQWFVITSMTATVMTLTILTNL